MIDLVLQIVCVRCTIASCSPFESFLKQREYFLLNNLLRNRARPDLEHSLSLVTTSNNSECHNILFCSFD